MPLILGAQSAVATGFSVDNSCRYNRPDNPDLSRTPGSDGNREVYTISCWVKRGNLGSYQPLFSTSGNNWADFKNDDTLRVACGNSTGNRTTTRLFRDTSAWMHFVFKIDTTAGDAADRLRIYINGVEETSFSASVAVVQDFETDMNWTGASFEVLHDGGGTRTLDGYAAEFVLLDGTAAAPTEFGEFDEDSPTIWKPKKVSGLTFGTNGLYLNFSDSADLGADSSGNGNDLTVANLAAADQATDTPTNNFAVLNYLSKDLCSPCTFTEGSCKTAQDSTSYYAWNLSTLGMTAGKWYFEGYLIDVGTTWAAIGITSRINPPNRAWTAGAYGPGYSNDTYGIALASYVGSYYKVGSSSVYGSSFTTDAVISVALDLDNNKCYFAKDGAWGDGSGTWDSTTFDAAVGDIALIAAASATDSGVYHFAIGNQSGSPTWGANFGGCPPVAPSSSVSDENGYGSFEYAPPSGYLALCTKNLGSDGG